MKKSIFDHFGPICSITNSKETLLPFVGPQLTGFILDHVFVNDRVDVFTHSIDTAKADGEIPSRLRCANFCSRKIRHHNSKEESYIAVLPPFQKKRFLYADE